VHEQGLADRRDGVPVAVGRGRAFRRLDAVEQVLGSSALRNTTCTNLGFGSPVYGLSARTRASWSLDRTTTEAVMPNAPLTADSRADAICAVSVSGVVKSTLPLWI